VLCAESTSMAHPRCLSDGRRLGKLLALLGKTAGGQPTSASAVLSGGSRSTRSAAGC
jgi:hypothetical protein